MKKGWKIFWIACGAVVGLGFAVAIAGCAMGATLQTVNGMFPHGILAFGNGRVYIGDGETIDAKEDFKGIHDIYLEVSGVNVEIVEADTDTVSLEVSNVDSRLELEYYKDDGELNIQTRKNIARVADGLYGTILLRVPKNRMEDIELNIGAGELSAQSLNAESLSIHAGAGEIQIDRFDAQDADFDCGVGSITAAGSTTEDISINCGIGETYLTLDGGEMDYNYDVKCGIGEVSLGGMSYSGIMGKKNEMDNGAARDMDVNCGIGSIEIDFVRGDTASE